MTTTIHDVKMYELTPLAILLLSQGSWPLSTSEASNVVFRYFIGHCGTAASKRKLMEKLGVEGDRFSVADAQAQADLQALAAIAELLMLGLAEARTVGPGQATLRDGPIPRGKRLTYTRTKEGSMASGALREQTAREMQKAGWP